MGESKAMMKPIPSDQTLNIGLSVNNRAAVFLEDYPLGEMVDTAQSSAQAKTQKSRETVGPRDARIKESVR
jgi:hypothetical protein